MLPVLLKFSTQSCLTFLHVANYEMNVDKVPILLTLEYFQEVGLDRPWWPATMADRGISP